MIKFNSNFRNSGGDSVSKCCTWIEDFSFTLSETVISDAEISVSEMYLFNTQDKNPHKLLGQFFKFIHVTYKQKFAELTDEFIDSINNKHFLTSALVGRSIIEATATLRFYNQKLIKKIHTRANKPNESWEAEVDLINESLELAMQHMKGTNFDWEQFFTSDKKTFVDSLVEKEKARLRKEKPVKPNYIKSQPVGKYLDNWFDDEPELVSFAYNFFSELVHPNLGSNLLLTGVSKDKLQIGINSNRAVGKTISHHAVLTLVPVIKEASKQLADSIFIAGAFDPID